jgi:uncharacterized SAM-binding protein YcdF (DUF218 family)
MVRPIRQIVFYRQQLQQHPNWWITMLFGVALLSFLIIGRDAVGIWSYTQRTSTSCQTQTVLVMGAAQYDGRPSPAFKRRLDKAHDLYERGCASNIVVTGGKREGDRFSEGEAGVGYLASLGIPGNFLQSETKSTSSYENLVLSKPLVDSDTLTIVTDDLHAYRTHFLATRLGYEVELETVVNPYKRVRYGIRELFMLVVYHLGIVR